MPPIAKTTIRPTILHEADLDLACRTLRDPAHGIDGGGMLGAHAIVAVEPVLPDGLDAACAAPGGTAAFFGDPDDGDTPIGG